MRRIDAPSSSAAPPLIDDPEIGDLEPTLQRMRTMYAEHREQEALAHKDDVCSPAAACRQDTDKERPEESACSRDLDEPRENIQRPARGKVRRSSLRRVSSEENDRRRSQGSPALEVSWSTDVESVSRHLLCFRLMPRQSRPLPRVQQGHGRR
jgi:hypothetical protein